jgi:hypothetical protein
MTTWQQISKRYPHSTQTFGPKSVPGLTASQVAHGYASELRERGYIAAVKKEFAGNYTVYYTKKMTKKERFGIFGA